MITERYDINITPGAVPTVINVSQYDAESRQYIFTPYSKDGQFPKVEGTNAYLEGTKPDGKVVFHECTYNEDGTVTYILHDQLAPVDGRVFSRISIRDEEGLIMGWSIILWVVEPAGIHDGARLSRSELDLLEQWYNEAMAAKDLAEYAIEYATDARDTTLAAIEAAMNALPITIPTIDEICV